MPVALALAALLAAGGCTREADTSLPRPMLGVAMSLRQVMPRLFDDYARRSGVAGIDATYDGSGNLRKQIEAGAPFDAVILADAPTVDGLIASGYADGGTRRVVATNRLILIGPKNAKPLAFETIETIPEGERLAIGEPAAVPAGRYAKQALEALGKWDLLKDRLVFGGHVAAVLQYARKGEVAAAIVYGTEIGAVDDVTVLDEAEGDWAPRAEVVVAATPSGRASGEGRAFLDYLASDRAREIFHEYGFGRP